jgi:polar amino acid transport system substrate-binding protein
MKPTTRFASWVCLILFMANTVGAELTILTEELPPYNYTENGKLTGATTQVVQEIMRRLGIDDPIAVVPWARGYQRLNNEAQCGPFYHGPHAGTGTTVSLGRAAF